MLESNPVANINPTIDGALESGPDFSTRPKPHSKSFLAKTSIFLAIATLLSRILGLVREMLIARYYGSSGQTDSLFFCINVAEQLRTVIISGAVASIFIPLFTDIQRQGKKDEAKRLAWTMLGFVSSITAAIVLLAEIGAPGIVKLSEILSLKGEPLDPERFELTVNLLRIILPVILFVSLWGLMGGILNSFDNFWVPGIAPLIWNITIIIVPIMYGEREQIRDIAWAWVIGHFLQMAFHLPWLWKIGIRPGLINWRAPMLKRFIIAAPAAILAYSAPSINAFIGQGVALNLGESAASSLYYAFRIEQLPIAVFGVSIATAIFPTLARHASSGSGKELVSTLAFGIRLVALAMIPASIFLIVFPAETVRLLFQRGQFTSQNTIDAALALYYYSWAIVPTTLTFLTNRTFFSVKDFKTPSYLGLISIFIFYVLCIFFAKNIGFSGIALATGLTFTTVLFVSIGIIHRRYLHEKSLLEAIGIRSIISMLIAGCLEAIAIMAVKRAFVNLEGTAYLLLMMTCAIAVGATTYFVSLKLMRNEDIASLIRFLFRRN